VRQATPDRQPTTVPVESSHVEWFSFVDATGQRWKRNLLAGPGEVPLVKIVDPPSDRDEENV
jgi:hypothetical protein